METVLKWKYPHAINGHSSSSVQLLCACVNFWSNSELDSLAVTPVGLMSLNLLEYLYNCSC